jgi:hypothetical protein
VGIVLTALLILTIPSGHVALLVMLAIQLSRPSKPAEPRAAFRCSYCNHDMRQDWRICPYCGWDLKTGRDAMHITEEKRGVDEA